MICSLDRTVGWGSANPNPCTTANGSSFRRSTISRTIPPGHGKIVPDAGNEIVVASEVLPLVHSFAKKLPMPVS